MLQKNVLCKKRFVNTHTDSIDTDNTHTDNIKWINTVEQANEFLEDNTTKYDGGTIGMDFISISAQMTQQRLQWLKKMLFAGSLGVMIPIWFYKDGKKPFFMSIRNGFARFICSQEAKEKVNDSNFCGFDEEYEQKIMDLFEVCNNIQSTSEKKIMIHMEQLAFSKIKINDATAVEKWKSIGNEIFLDEDIEAASLIYEGILYYAQKRLSNKNKSHRILQAKCANNIAICMEKLNKTHEAEKYNNIALKLDPEYNKCKQRRQRLMKQQKRNPKDEQKKQDM